MPYPWFVAKFSSTVKLVSIKIWNRQDCCGERLQNVEVRAGTIAIDPAFSGRITANTLCGSFVGPGATSGVYTITCQTPIVANLVSLQTIDSTDSYIQAAELEFATAGKHPK